MALPGTLAQFATITWPNDVDPPDEATMRFFTAAVARIIGASPAVLSAYAGQLVAVNGSGAGFTPLGTAGLIALDFAGTPIVRSPGRGMTLTGAVTLKSMASGTAGDYGHDGASIDFDSSSAITITIALDSTGRNGIRNDFQCAMWRVGSGIVQLGSMPSGVTLVPQTTGHTKVAAGGAPALLRLRNGRLFFWGATEA